MAQNLNRFFTKEDILIANKHEEMVNIISYQVITIKTTM